MNATPALPRLLLSTFVACTALAACVPGDGYSDEPGDDHLHDEPAEVDEDAASSPSHYVELEDFLGGDADRAAWRTLRERLAQAFDDVCGDTFCEGDYTNLESLDFSCTVSSKKGRLRECAWTFAASDERVDAASGAVAATVPFFVCRTQPRGAAGELLAALADDPLRASLPGLDHSLYDSLSDCFEAPLHSEPLPDGGPGPYADVADSLEGDAVDAWYAMTRGLREEFATWCDGVFCDADDPNLTALRLRCSKNAETGKLGSCSWSFASSDSSPKTNGKLAVTPVASTCTFTADATPLELALALAPDPAGTLQLLRPLPNAQTSVFDALVDCLAP